MVIGADMSLVLQEQKATQQTSFQDGTLSMHCPIGEILRVPEAATINGSNNIEST